MIGSTVGRYRIDSKLGEGGMGSVWKAEDTILRRNVALKFLPDSLAGHPDARRRFLHEARAASALDHPCIATVYDAGEENGRLFIAIAHVRGETVSERAARKPFPVHEAVRVGIAAAEALSHAHANGVVHRDVSGRNIMLAEDGRVVVLDFGLALHQGASRITGSTRIVGTPGYLSPEVASGMQGDHRSDIFGLGVVLYEMLTGRLPFEGAVVAALLYQVVYCDPEPPSARRSDVPAALDTIVLKAMARDPAARYSSAEEFAAALGSEAGRRTARARHVPRSRRSQRPLSAGRASTAPMVPVGKLLAVLPFTDMSSDPGLPTQREIFARGLAEAVGNSLSRFGGVQIVPSTVQPGLLNADADPRQIARSLGANLVMRGTIQRSGGRLRVTYSIHRSDASVQISGDTVDGAIDDLLGIEDRLVASAARCLGLGGSWSPAVVREASRDPAAREHYLQALGYLQRHENEASVAGAITLLEDLQRTEGDSAPILALLGRAFLARYRLTHRIEFEKLAASACERAIELDPESPEAQVTLGQIHQATGRYAEAACAFQLALVLRPDNPDALIGLSSARESEGKLKEAEQACRDAIAQRPRDWRGHNRLGAFFFNRGRYADAAESWRHALTLAPDHAWLQSNHGSAHLHLGRFEEAIECFRRSLEIQPNSVAYSSLGTALFFLGRYDESAATFEKGAALRPFSPLSWGNLADAYRWIPGNEDKTTTAYRQAITLAREELELNPHHGVVWCRLALWHAKQGEFPEALSAIERGLALSPEDVSCMARAVTVYHLAGERAKALEWLGQALGEGFGPAEFERDPELAALRSEEAYREILREAMERLDTDVRSTGTQPRE